MSVIFTDKNEKAQIKRAFQGLLVQNDYSLRSWCAEQGTKFPYARTHERLTRNSISLSEVNEMIHTIDESLSLQNLNGFWQIQKS